MIKWDSAGGSCNCGNRIEVKNGIVQYSCDEHLHEISEVEARDSQSDGYLKHAKFPIQIHRINRFLKRLPNNIKTRPVLDLGCGPGPTTNLLLKNGYKVVAVDFSEKSLLLNSKINSSYDSMSSFVKADLNNIRFADNSTYLLMMCDFLQHLGQYEDRILFLKHVYDSLIPGGYFYLSFFNFNIKNYLKGDIRGTFADGNIKYERLLYKEVVGSLPASIKIDAIIPMNIFHSVLPDRLLAAIPGACYLSRMIAISGQKRV